MEYGYFNADCMDIMRELPDKSINLAIVDPPYGDGGVPGRRRTRVASEAGSTGTSIKNRRDMGRKIRQKNHSVGHCAAAGIL